MWDYTDKVRDHYLNPRNVGELKEPDGFGEIGNLACGDALRLTFKLDENGKVEDIRFKTFGCGSAIASASVLTEMCKGKTLDEIKKISNKDIADALGGLPKEKMHCSVMGQEALEAAIKFYENGGKIQETDHIDGELVCTCFGVTDKMIEKAVVENDLKTLKEVTNFTKAGGACGMCHEKIQTILNKILGKKTEEQKSVNTPKLTTLQKIDKIRETIVSAVNPILAHDGGSCELIDVNGDEVIIELKGHCSKCAFSELTLKSVVEKKLQELVSDKLSVKIAED